MDGLAWRKIIGPSDGEASVRSLPFPLAPVAIPLSPASIMVSRRYPARGWQMPFDNPHQGAIRRSRTAGGGSRSHLQQGHLEFKAISRKEGAYCLVASLSSTCGSRSFGMPNRTELRLSRLVVMQMPPDAPFWMRHRFLPARRRLIAFNDDLLTQHEDVMALLTGLSIVWRVRHRSSSPPDQVTRLRYRRHPTSRRASLIRHLNLDGIIGGNRGRPSAEGVV